MKLVFFFIIVFVLIGSVSAIPDDADSSIDFSYLTTTNFSTINVNDSIYWDNNLWSDTRWLNIDGSNANSNIDIGVWNFSATHFIGDAITTTGTGTFGTPFTINPTASFSVIRTNDADAILTFEADRTDITRDAFRWRNADETFLMGLTDNGELSTGKLIIERGDVYTATFTNTGGGVSGGAGMIGLSDDGAAITSGDRLGFYTLGGAYNSAHNVDNTVAMSGFATENWDNTNRGSELKFETTANGAVDRTVQLVIGQDGTADFQAGNITTTGTINNAADNSQHTWGAAGATDSYIQFGGTNLEYYSSGIHDFLAGDITTTGTIQGANYKSGDGSAGITQSETGVTDFDIVIKDGLITSFTKNA